jgi:CheY-like chemotaxis protein
MAHSFAPTALIVDDNFYNRDLCTLALEHVGYSITEAENGLEAMRLLRQQSYTLLVLDLAMPELNGIEVIRKLRSEPVHQDMSIIVMTANPHMATPEVEVAADFIMNKPIGIEEFARLAQRLAQPAVGSSSRAVGL